MSLTLHAARRALVPAAALALSLAAPTAHATPLAEVVQNSADAALRADLSWDRPARTLVATQDLPANAQGAYYLDSTTVEVLPEIVGRLDRPRRPGGAAALIVIVHEGLHYRTGCYSEIEEWITQAKALDELPYVSRAVWGFPLRVPANLVGSGTAVAAVRALSARATGSRTWRDPRAWAFREALWRAPMLPGGCALRDSLLSRG